uniref:Uncharacterized protein n=1 Tax=Anguilla anguilla TaxID=7936 RepID=A0A0E9RBU4_ANGAN
MYTQASTLQASISVMVYLLWGWKHVNW